MAVKILLVDDEDYIRQGIRYTIPWETHGMEIVGEAANGVDALRLSQKLRPDIILVDIQMPVINGIELTERLGDLVPEAKVIILTAFGNIENLSQAIQARVSGFLLKTADSGQILDTVMKVKEELEIRQRQDEQTVFYKSIFDENRHLIKSTLLSRFLLGQISYQQFVAKAKKIDLPTQSSSYALLLLRCDSENEQQTLGHFFYLFREYQPFAFFIENKLALIILDTSDKCLESDEIEDILPSLLPLAFGSHLIIMMPLLSFADFPYAYHQMFRQLDYCFWETKQPYTLLSPHDNFLTAEIPDIHLSERNLISATFSQNNILIAQELHDFYQYMNDFRIPRHLFIETITHFLIFIHASFNETFDLLETISSLSDYQTAKEIITLIEGLLLPDKIASSHAQLSLAISYIHEHYAKDFSLDDVARFAYLSPGYLSRLFKSEIGYSFKEYLHLTRIQKAQELLRNTRLRYYEIAEQVGYKNYKYFSSYFSKITGCSAKEYQLLHAKSP